MMGIAFENDEGRQSLFLSFQPMVVQANDLMALKMVRITQPETLWDTVR
jgi:hypothetical protein